MYHLAVGFGFHGMVVDTTPVSKVWMPLPLFPIGVIPARDVSRVLAEVETEAERFLGSFGSKDYDALSSAKLPNGGCLNRVFEQMEYHMARAHCRVPKLPRR
jgi:hypothetical protein